MPFYIVKKYGNSSYTQVGLITEAEMQKITDSRDPNVVANDVLSTVKKYIKDTGDRALYFSDQDPSNNDLGSPVVAEEMGKLVGWVNNGSKNVYFFDK